MKNERKERTNGIKNPEKLFLPKEAKDRLAGILKTTILTKLETEGSATTAKKAAG